MNNPITLDILEQIAVICMPVILICQAVGRKSLYMAIRKIKELKKENSPRFAATRGIRIPLLVWSVGFWFLISDGEVSRFFIAGIMVYGICFLMFLVRFVVVYWFDLLTKKGSNQSA